MLYCVLQLNDVQARSDTKLYALGENDWTSVLRLSSIILDKVIQTSPFTLLPSRQKSKKLWLEVSP